MFVQLFTVFKSDPYMYYNICIMFLQYLNDECINTNHELYCIEQSDTPYHLVHFQISVNYILL